jgi:hypothetical protein
MLNIFKEEYFIKFENYVEKDVLTEEELNNGELPDTNVYIIDVCNAIKKQFTFEIFDRLNESNSFNMQYEAFGVFY